MRLTRGRRAAGLAAAFLLTALSAPAYGVGTPHSAQGAPDAHARLTGVGECTYPMKPYKPRPWPLQRVVLDELWRDTKGEGVRVAVIDTGVDDVNPQLKGAVDKKRGLDLLGEGKHKDPTADAVGHGTKAAGIIAARPHDDTGFVGLAPAATIIPIRQNDEKQSGTDQTLAHAIDHAIAQQVGVINISQDTIKKPSKGDLAAAVEKARQKDIVVVASAGNDGADGKLRNTYPAAYDGVLAVAASDRNDERAYFSQSGDFVGVAAPGVDVVSTVPKGGQCVDNGTSFSAPYVAGVAALIRAKCPKWDEQQVVAQIEQTAERTVNGRDPYVGWGVVDPVRAVNDADPEHPIDHVTADNHDAAHHAPAPDAAPLTLGETAHEREERLATYVVGVAAVLVAIVVGAAVVVRDWNRRHRA